MSQVDYNVANADGASVRADINSQLDAIVTNNSGGSEPTTKFADMWWYDTADNDLKQRNETNTAWVLVARKDGSGWTPYFGTTLLALATESALGVAETATQGETDAGVLDTKIVTPLKLKNSTTTGLEAGTRVMFQQTAAPTGWTKEAVHNDKAIRLVTGSVGTGGDKAFSTTFGSGKTTDSHAVSEAEMPSHVHAGGAAAPILDAGSGGRTTTRAQANTSAKGGGANHIHNLTNFNLRFVDFIIAIKD